MPACGPALLWRLLLVSGLLLATLVVAPAGPAGAHDSYEPIGRFPEPEGSGVVASRTYPGVFWAHRDSGSGTRNVLYAFRVVDGRLVDLTPGVQFRTFAVPGLVNRDWEDLAIDDRGHLWLGDIGNNGCRRDNLAVHELIEPDPYSDGSVDVVASYRFTWPDPPGGCTGYDSESLLVVDNLPSLISKTSRPALYRFATLSPTAANRLEHVTDVTPPAEGFDKLTTAADVSTDGARLVLATAAYQMWVYETPNAGLRGEGLLVDLLHRPPAYRHTYRADGGNDQVEGAAFAVGSHDVLLLSEGRALRYLPAATYDGGSEPPRRSGRRVLLAAETNVQAAVAYSAFAVPAAGGVGDAVLARDDVFADSLAAGALEGLGGGRPLLLTPSDELAAETAAELERLDARRVTILGGATAVGPGVEDGLRARGYEVRRLAGATRVDTAVAVAAHAFPDATVAFVARAFADGDDPTRAFVDALAAGGAAAASGTPVLLTDSGHLSPPARQHLANSRIAKVIVVGGPAAVSDAVVGELRSLGLEVVRAGGANRFETAVALAQLVFGFDDLDQADGVLLVEGQRADAWADGLPGGLLGAAFDYPVLLASGDTLPSATQAYLETADGSGTHTLVCGPFATDTACERAGRLLNVS
jgi:putative cell wall-binding protein